MRLSASANADFQACQHRYLLSYIYDLAADKDKDSLRIGTTWHRCHEILEMTPGGQCPDCLRHEELRPDCDLCTGTGFLPDDMMTAVVRYLSRAYAEVPDNKTHEEWEAERTGLLYCLSGHRWLYSNDDRWETIGSEVKFEVPVAPAKPGSRRLTKAVFVGKADRLIRDRHTGLVYVWERKSTGHPITSENYWTGLTQGDQVTGYIFGMRLAQKLGQLRKYGIKKDDPEIAGAFVDVWHKPDISPKTLSQKDTKEFLDTGEYFGETFNIVNTPEGGVVVNGTPATIIEGKQAFAIRETAEMYGARLLADIAERPNHYFAQREVCRTQGELDAFQDWLYRLARQIRHVEQKDLWCKNRKSCRQPFYCEFLSLCESGAEVGPSDAPPGYIKKHASKFEEVTLG